MKVVFSVNFPTVGDKVEPGWKVTLWLAISVRKQQAPYEGTHCTPGDLYF